MSAHRARMRKLRRGRNVSSLLFVAIGAFAVWANVIASDPVWWKQCMHAAAPVVFVAVVEVLIHFGDEVPAEWRRWLYPGAGVVALASFLISYTTLRHTAAAAGMTWEAWLFPLLCEVAALSFSVVALALSERAAAVEAEERDAQRAAAEAERAAEERAEAAARRAAEREADRQILAEHAASQPQPEPPQAERDALALAERYPDGLPPQRAIAEALGWSKGKVAEAAKAHRAMGPAVPELAASNVPST